MEQQCQAPPSGWLCTRGSGHDGPCAAVPDIEYFSNAAEARVAKLVKLVEAADYLQHCRRRKEQYLGYGLENAKKSVDRASDHYDFLRSQVKM